MGVAIARLPTTTHRKAGLAVAIAGALAIVLLGQAIYGLPEKLFTMETWTRPFYWGIPAAFIVWGTLQWEQTLRRPGWKWLGRLGDASYSLYLTHPLVLTLGPDNPYLKLPLMPPLCVLVSLLVHNTVELPLLDWSRRLLRPIVETGKGTAEAHAG